MRELEQQSVRQRTLRATMWVLPYGDTKEQSRALAPPHPARDREVIWGWRVVGERECLSRGGSCKGESFCRRSKGNWEHATPGQSGLPGSGCQVRKFGEQAYQETSLQVPQDRHQGPQPWWDEKPRVEANRTIYYFSDARIIQKLSCENRSPLSCREGQKGGIKSTRKTENVHKCSYGRNWRVIMIIFEFSWKATNGTKNTWIGKNKLSGQGRLGHSKTKWELI